MPDMVGIGGIAIDFPQGSVPFALSRPATRIDQRSRGALRPGIASQCLSGRQSTRNAGCRPHPWPACNKERRRQ